MPIRRSRPKTSCSLRQLLNWVAYDDFDGPLPTGSEVSAAVFGDVSNVEEIEFAQFTRLQAEDEAKADILDALIAGAVSGIGHYSDKRTIVAKDWRDITYGGHLEKPKPISQDSWQLGKVDWDGDSLKTPSGEYIQVRFVRDEVLNVWRKPENQEDQSSNLEDKFIATMAKAAVSGELPAEFEESKVIELLSDLMGPAAANALFYEKLNQGFFRQITADPMTFEITMHLLRQAKTLSDSIQSPDTMKNRVKNAGTETENDEAQLPDFVRLPHFGKVGDIAAPASDRIVTINHNTSEYRDVVEKLGALKAAVESNNEYRSENLDDHERRLTDIETTLKILENKRVRVGTIRVAAYGTLVYLAEKFADEPIGALAQAAWEALKTLLGIS